MLERLGHPAEIAAEARELRRPAPAGQAGYTPWLKVVAIVLLVSCSLLAIGVVSVWLLAAAVDDPRQADRHRRAERVLAGLGVIAARATSLAVAPSGSDSPPGQAPVGTTGPGLVEVVLVTGVAPFVLPISPPSTWPWLRRPDDAALGPAPTASAGDGRRAGPGPVDRNRSAASRTATASRPRRTSRAVRPAATVAASWRMASPIAARWASSNGGAERPSGPRRRSR